MCMSTLNGNAFLKLRTLQYTADEGKVERHRGRNGRKCEPENFIRRYSPLDDEQT